MAMNLIKTQHKKKEKYESDGDELEKIKNWKAHSMENKPKNVGALITRIKRQFAKTIRLPSQSRGEWSTLVPTRLPRLVDTL